jgi:hypothetical protein
MADDLQAATVDVPVDPAVAKSLSQQIDQAAIDPATPLGQFLADTKASLADLTETFITVFPIVQLGSDIYGADVAMVQGDQAAVLSGQAVTFDNNQTQPIVSVEYNAKLDVSNVRFPAKSILQEKVTQFTLSVTKPIQLPVVQAPVPEPDPIPTPSLISKVLSALNPF